MTDTEEQYTIPHLPTDAGEIEDYVQRKGPITYRRLCQDTGWMAPDKISDCLVGLEERGRLKRIKSNFPEHGTSRDRWVSTDG